MSKKQKLLLSGAVAANSRFSYQQLAELLGQFSVKIKDSLLDQAFLILADEEDFQVIGSRLTSLLMTPEEKSLSDYYFSNLR